MASRRESEGGALDLVPIMNLVTILIPFLLMSTHFVGLSIVDVTMPAIGPDEIEEEPVERLSLKILITEDGYTVASDSQEIGEDGELSVQLTEGGTDALHDLLADIKRDWPDEDMVVLVPDPDTSYDLIIRTMDAARSVDNEDLFPNVIIAGGAE